MFGKDIEITIKIKCIFGTYFNVFSGCMSIYAHDCTSPHYVTLVNDSLTNEFECTFDSYYINNSFDFAFNKYVTVTIKSYVCYLGPPTCTLVCL